MKGTFTALNANAEIFKRIEQEKPQWWRLFCNDTDLYKDIRKDNYINVYYLGASIAKIAYKKGFVAEINRKYLAEGNSSNKTYARINLEKLDQEMLSSIKRKIEGTLRDSKNEHPSEKRIQGEMRTKNLDFIDSEFQYNQDPNIKNLRIDLVELKDGELTFIELKGISDNRLRNDEAKNKEKPEVIRQMKTYKSFIAENKTALYDFYKKLIQIKYNLGLVTENVVEFKVNPIPKLLIANTYKKQTPGKKKRIEAIEKLLNKEGIVYEIKNWK